MKNKIHIICFQYLKMYISSVVLLNASYKAELCILSFYCVSVNILNIINVITNNYHHTVNYRYVFAR